MNVEKESTKKLIDNSESFLNESTMFEPLRREVQVK